jgi:hypothetical protein
LVEFEVVSPNFTTLIAPILKLGSFVTSMKLVRTKKACTLEISVKRQFAFLEAI